jgi:hypothetical protein
LRLPSNKPFGICKYALIALFCVLLAGGAISAQEPLKPAPAPKPATGNADPAAFLHTADEVMAEMSKLLGLQQIEPLKKSLRSRDEIRAYLIQQMKEDKDADKRYADEKTLEKLGLLPKNFPMESFLLDLLTEQIAGLYDPKAGEFYIADWIAPEDQREVMAHELTHALQDQHYHIDPWRDAAKPNDDAEGARDAVLEGSAVASMLDYGLRQQGSSLAAVGSMMSFSTLLGKMDDSSPLLSKAPKFIQDALLFPYAAGADFSQAILLKRGGWPGFHNVFENPPVSTQQIMHPEMYLNGVLPENVAVPDLTDELGEDWKKLDSNILGEFGLNEILKHFLGDVRANQLSPLWAGDRYAIYERKTSGGKTDEKDATEDLLVLRFHTSSPENAARLFGGLSEASEKKYEKRTNLFRRPNFFSFDSAEGGVFLRCAGQDCVTLEGGDRKLFDALVRALHWPANPDAPASPDTKVAPTKAELLVPIPPAPQPIPISIPIPY